MNQKIKYFRRLMNWEIVVTVENERLLNKFKKEAILSSKRNQLGKLQLSKIWVASFWGIPIAENNCPSFWNGCNGFNCEFLGEFQFYYLHQ